MKYLFIPFAIAAVAMAACTTEIEEPIYKDSPQITITATNIPPDATRTTVQDGGTQVLWESSYEIAVFYNGTGGLRFSLTQEGIKKITFGARNKAKLSAAQLALVTDKGWILG